MGLGLFFDGRISPSRRTVVIIPHQEKQVKPWLNGSFNGEPELRTRQYYTMTTVL